MAEREKPASAAKSSPKKSKYIDTLSREALARYDKKLELIDGDLKPIKSTEAYNKFFNGFVREIKCFYSAVKLNDKVPDEDQICCVTSWVSFSASSA